MKYSVIVPVYNTEQYLEECVGSVLNQEGDVSFELIPVDNGSQDNAGAMCDAYAEKDARVRVIHQENRHAGGGRNAGLRIAQGEYIISLDSDDFWEPTMLSTVDKLLMNGPDMVCFGYYRLFQDGKVETHHQIGILPDGESGAVWMEQLFAREATPEIVPWCYAYRRDFLSEHTLTYREDLWGPEDFEFNMRAIPLAKSVVGTATPLYYNRVRPGSIMNSRYLQTYLDGLTVTAEAYRRMLYPGLADYYAQTVVGITQFDPPQTEKAIFFIKDNLDILEHTTSRRKLLLPLIRIFGIYNGARIYQSLQNIKASLLCRNQ